MLLRSRSGSGVLGAEAEGVNDTFGQTRLREDGLVAISLDVDAKKAFGGAFLAKLDVRLLHALNKRVDGRIVASIDQ